jgi:UDP:flavonoid glycosyltransferase YjiC (YdhE family)
MRALFVATAGIGHVFPMVPLAWALRAGGHDVLFVTTGPALAVQRAGLPVADCAPGVDPEVAAEQLKQYRPDLYDRMQALQNEKQADLRDTADFFAAMSSFQAGAVLDIAAGWGPDVVVQSQLEGSGLIAAGKLGIPLVQHGGNLARTNGLLEMYREHMSDAFDQHGITDIPERTAMIQVAPPSTLAGAVDGWLMRYVPYNGGGVMPEWVLQQGNDRPRVAVTLGTVVPGHDGLGEAEGVIAAAEGVDADFVLALGGADASSLGTLPPNVRLIDWIPLNMLLASCSAIVHHGGGGTTLTSVAAGVPQLVMTGGAGRHVNAIAVRDRGVGLVTENGLVDTDMLNRLIYDQALRTAALEVQAELRDMPSPTSVAARLVDFAA